MMIQRTKMELLPAASAPLFKLCFCSWATLILSLSTTARVAAAGDLPANETDRLSLLAFRDALTVDPAVVALRSWNATVHHCQWRGVTCSRWHAGRVTALNLSSFGLSGHISPSVANLTFLREIDLSINQFRGSVPPQLGALSRLRYLYVGNNTLGGEIPSNLSRCSELRILEFSYNRLTGEIPASLGGLPKLTVLVAESNKITGPIPASLGNLSSGLFQTLWLGGNKLTGGIPGELGRLGSLNFLGLDQNKLSGTIPAASLYNLSNLEVFSVSDNGMLSGALPPDLGAIFPRLRFMYVDNNQFQGSIPKSLSNASSLQKIDLSRNLLQGGIPGELGRLRNLKHLGLSLNHLSGTIPASLYNLSNLEVFDVVANGMLSGALPPDLGALFPRLSGLYVGENQFHGSIPKSLSNASSLHVIDLSFNLLQGVIPDDLGLLQQLDIFNVAVNKLQAREPKHWKFLTALTNCTKLRLFSIANNELHGELPSSIANLSTTLQWLSVAANQISGSIPPGIGNLVGLTKLVLGRNQFAGGIPSTFGKLGNLSILVLGQTKLSGEIPSELGNLTRLSYLRLDQSNLSGTIPASMGRLRQLERMDLSINSLEGSMPEGLFTSPTTLVQLDLSGNHLEGSFPPTVGRLLSMSYLNVSGNRLSGHIPTTIGDWQNLQALDLHGNSFGGTIPASLASIRGIEVMDLSQNNLTGGIPEFLGTFKYLQYLNLSFNSFTGEVPNGGVFANASAVSLLGNKDVCGGISQLRLPTCAHSSNSHINVIVITVAVVGVFLLLSLLCLVAYFCWRTRKLREGRSTPAASSSFEVEAHERISYHDLVKATDGFSHDNLIGRGGSGSVFKGVLDGGRSIAVKVLNVQSRGALKSFKSECEALRNIRHRNLVKIVSVCSSVDFSGNDFKALVFEFFQNGSLERWLHLESREGVRILNFAQRLSIATDVASALDYLHNHGDSPIVHCDLKPSNVLLDDDMVARVGDFGLARFIPGGIIKRESQSSTIGIKGSVGYIAPEYGLGSPASTSGDVYSFGILLLELFTTKSPIDDMFKDGLSLQKFVEAALSLDGATHMVHPLLQAQLISDAVDTSHQGPPNNNGTDPIMRTGECFVSLMRIGLNCAKESPHERMTTGDVVKEMRRVQEAFVGVARPTTF